MTPSFLVLTVLAATNSQGPGLDSLWYVRGEESILAFLAHADQVSIVSPQRSGTPHRPVHQVRRFT